MVLAEYLDGDEGDGCATEIWKAIDTPRNQARKARWTYDLTIEAHNLAQVIPVYTSPSQVL